MGIERFVLPACQGFNFHPVYTMYIVYIVYIYLGYFAESRGSRVYNVPGILSNIEIYMHGVTNICG